MRVSRYAAAYDYNTVEPLSHEITPELKVHRYSEYKAIEY